MKVVLASAVHALLIASACSFQSICETTEAFGTCLSASRDMAALAEWADDHGVVFGSGSRLLRTDAQRDDWGVILEQDAPEGSVVLSVPSDLILSSENLRSELETSMKIGPAIRHLEENNHEELVPQFFLFVKILKEWSEEYDSKWYPWLQSLPPSFDAAPYMNDIEVALLPPFGSALARLERLHCQAFQNAFQMIQDSKNFNASSINEERLRWAFCVVFSRSWRSEELQEQGVNGLSDIVPLGDMFNHNSDANVVVRYTEHPEDSGTVDFVLKEDATAGSPLFLSYGLPTNPYRFLCIFGFVDEQQLEIFSQILFANPTVDHLALGCNERTKMVFRVQDGAVAKAVWDSVLYAILEQKPEVRWSFIEGDSDTRASIHATYRLEVCITIHKHVTNTCQEIVSLLEESDKVNPEDHPRLEMIRRLNVRLLETFGKVKVNLEAMIRQEGARRIAAKESASGSAP